MGKGDESRHFDDEPDQDGLRGGVCGSLVWGAQPASPLRARARVWRWPFPGYWSASGCGSRPRSRSRSRSRCRATLRRLDFDSHWRTGLKEPNCRVGSLWRLVGVEPEVIQRAEANGIGVCVLRDSFAVPSYRRVARLVIIRPRRAAVPGVSLGAIVCEARMLRRRMKPDVTDVNSRS